MARMNERLLRVMEAAFNGDEDGIGRALQPLNESELSRLRNTLRAVGDLTEEQRVRVWRRRHG